MGARIRAALATLTSAPWKRAPVLLLRRPGVLLAVAGATAVMVASVAAVPLFLSSVGTETVALQAAGRCPRDTGAQQTLFASAREVRAPSADPFASVADRLGPSNRWLALERTRLEHPDTGEVTPATLLVRDGALEHVEPLEGELGPGLWISDRAAALTGLAAGEPARIGTEAVPVAGVYRDLSGPSVDDFWCSNAELLLLDPELVPPPPLLIVDPDTFARLMGAVGADRAAGVWEAPLRPGLTVTDTRALVATLACSRPDGDSLPWCRGGDRPNLPGFRGGGVGPEGTPARDDAEFVERYLSSHLPFLNDRSKAIQTAVGGGVWPMALFGTLAGVGLVAAAGSLWFDRRRREVTLLTVRGVGPAGIGGKAVLELLIPLVGGAALGTGAAYVAVVRVGPNATLEPAAVRQAVLGGLFALAGAAATILAVVARRSGAHQRRAGRRWAAWVPWELALGGATLAAFERLGDWGIPVGRGAEVTRVDVLGLLFPVLFLVTAVALLSRVLLLLLRPLRAASCAWPTALYLGVRRVARYRVAVVGLMGASALAAGLLGYASTMHRSLDATLQAKGRTFVGSDLAVRTPAEVQVPSALADRATEVDVYWRSTLSGEVRTRVAVVAVDPATFARAAFWDDSFADASLEEVLDRLGHVPGDGPTPVIVVGAPTRGPVTLGLDGPGTQEIAVEPLPGVTAFPGTKRGKPTVFVARAALDDLELHGRTPELWIRGDRDDALAVLEPTGTSFTEVRRLADVADSAAFLTVSWTFGFMRSLGVSAGLLVVGGVAVYLDARRRDRLLGHAFMLRMGLTRAQHRRAMAVELAASVLVGCGVGLGSALTAAWLAYPEIDPVPTFRPAPLLRPAVGLSIGLAALALVLVAVAAAAGQRRIDLDDPVEVLRGGV